MSANAVIALIVAVLAVAGLAFVKVGELAGVGRPAPYGSLRAPHGRLVRTVCLDDPAELGFTQRLARVGGLVLAALAVTLGLGLLVGGQFRLSGVLTPSLDLIAGCAIALALTSGEAGPWRALGYALTGYLAGGVLATAVGMGPLGADTATVNVLTMALGSLGLALAVAWMPAKSAWAREFEDGHVNAIRVSDRSAAARAYRALADPAWKPPADRIRHARAVDVVRAHREEKDDHGQ